MAGRSKTNVYDRTVSITSDYLGPASERFVDRQILGHLQKRPKEMTAQDLVKLMDWFQTAMSVLTDDTKVVEEYLERLWKLIPNPRSAMPFRRESKNARTGSKAA